MPVPAGAMLKEFQIEGMAGSFKAELLPRDEARRIYDEIVRRMIDPGLLEFAGTGLGPVGGFSGAAGGTMKARVVVRGIAGGGKRRVDYVLPRSEQRRSGVAMVAGDGLENAGRGGGGVLPVASGGDRGGRGRPCDIAAERGDAGGIVARDRGPASARGAASLSIAAYPPAGGEDGYFLLLAARPAAARHTHAARGDLGFRPLRQHGRGQTRSGEGRRLPDRRRPGGKRDIQYHQLQRGGDPAFPGAAPATTRATLDARAFIRARARAAARISTMPCWRRSRNRPRPACCRW